LFFLAATTIVSAAKAAGLTTGWLFLNVCFHGFTFIVKK
jgi:hypothetical protein